MAAVQASGVSGVRIKNRLTDNRTEHMYGTAQEDSDRTVSDVKTLNKTEPVHGSLSAYTDVFSACLLWHSYGYCMYTVQLCLWTVERKQGCGGCRDRSEFKRTERGHVVRVRQSYDDNEI